MHARQVVQPKMSDVRNQVLPGVYVVSDVEQ